MAEELLEKFSEEEEDDDSCELFVSMNDRTSAAVQYLVGLKGVISEQLPNMPRSYITRVIMDRKHRAVCATKRGRVIGGCVFRPFFDQGFCEIVFLAITEVEKRRSYGSRVMGFMKEYVKQFNMKYFLTFADNLAIKFFKKHGFVERNKTGADPFRGFYKEYVESTLMECSIDYSVDYLAVSQEPTVEKPKNSVTGEPENETLSNEMLLDLPVFEGIPEFKDPLVSKVSVRDIPGVLEGHLKAISKTSDLQAKLGYVLKKMTGMKDIWPFRKPVRREDVPDYFNYVQKPMALSIIKEKYAAREYTTKQEFIDDFQLLISNCRKYNRPETVYCKCAAAVEARFNSLMNRLGKWESHLDQIRTTIEEFKHNETGPLKE